MPDLDLIKQGKQGGVGGARAASQGQVGPGRSLDRLAPHQLQQISINPGIDPGARRRCDRMSGVLSSYEGGAIAPRRSRCHPT
jgi:hypothetical protein